LVGSKTRQEFSKLGNSEDHRRLKKAATAAGAMQKTQKAPPPFDQQAANMIFYQILSSSELNCIQRIQYPFKTIFLEMPLQGTLGVGTFFRNRGHLPKVPRRTAKPPTLRCSLLSPPPPIGERCPGGFSRAAQEMELSDRRPLNLGGLASPPSGTCLPFPRFAGCSNPGERQANYVI